MQAMLDAEHGYTQYALQRSMDKRQALLQSTAILDLATNFLVPYGR